MLFSFPDRIDLNCLHVWGFHKSFPGPVRRVKTTIWVIYGPRDWFVKAPLHLVFLYHGARMVYGLTLQLLSCHYLLLGFQKIIVSIIDKFWCYMYVYIQWNMFFWGLKILSTLWMIFYCFLMGKKGTQSLLHYMCVCGQSVLLSVRVRARIPWLHNIGGPLCNQPC